MVPNEPIELRFYAAAPDDANVFTKAYQVKLDGEILSGSVLAAGFHVNAGRRQYLKLTLSDGLHWNDATKTLTVRIQNSQLAFIRDDAELQYEAFIMLDNKQTMTFREGTASAVRVG